MTSIDWARILFEGATDLLCTAGIDGYFRAVNPAWDRVLGYPSGELLKRQFLDFVHPDDLQATLDVVGHLGGATGVTTISFCNRYRKYDGTYVKLEWNARSIPGDLIAATARDRTPFQEIEEDLGFFRTALENTTDFVGMCDLDRQMIYGNRALLDLRGLPSLAEARQQHIEYFTPEWATRLIASEAIPTAMREGIWRGDSAFLDAHGREVPTSQVVIALRGADGSISRFSTIARETTVAKELAEKLVQLERYREAMQQLGTPIIEVWDRIVALPVIGVIDSRRSAEMMERLLQRVSTAQVNFVILDLTGVDVVDTATADHFIRMARAIKLIGARCIITGIRPDVALTLVSSGVEMSGLTTLRTLKDGLELCLKLVAKQRDAREVPTNAAKFEGG